MSKTIVLFVIFMLGLTPLYANVIENIATKLTNNEITSVEDFVRGFFPNESERGYVVYGKLPLKTLERMQIESMFPNKFGRPSARSGQSLIEEPLGGDYVISVPPNGNQYRIVEFDGEDKSVLVHELAHVYGADEETARTIEFAYRSRH